jgi:DNA-binding MarR family transcriptional regulator
MSTLHRLSQTADRLANELRELCLSNEQALPDTRVARDRATSLAAAMLKVRRMLEQAITSDIFSDPVRDILLDLYVSEARGKCTTVTSACIASCVPPTTALRHLANMEREGLIESAEASDGRVRMVSLTPTAKERLERYLGSAALILATALQSA